MLQKHINCWLTTKDGDAIVEESPRNDQGNTMVVDVRMDEEQAYIVHWKYVGEVPLSARCEVYARHAHGSTRLLGVRHLDASRPETQEGDSSGIFYRGEMLRTTNADQRSGVLGAIIIVFYRTTDNTDDIYAKFLFSLRKAGFQRHHILARVHNPVTARKRKATESYSNMSQSNELFFPKRSRVATRRYEPERNNVSGSQSSRVHSHRNDHTLLDLDSEALSEGASALDELIDNHNRLQNERRIIEKEEHRMQMQLQKQNEELKEQNQARLARLLALKKQVANGPPSAAHYTGAGSSRDRLR
ncbi:unnamed protein product [Somion occarium]|uniref:Uncharacterized protein n=1 Tax=Somion occarium TaxID=3059160 RepID=A0ABP1CZX4_9APHY